MKGKMANKQTVIEAPRKVGRGITAMQSCGSSISNDGIVDDDFSLNRSRRETSDGSQKANAILRPNRPVRISTYNARTLREEWRFEEIVTCMSEYNIDIFGVQEHRRVNKNEITFENKNGYQLIITTAWRNKQKAAIGGLGVILSKTAESALCKV